MNKIYLLSFLCLFIAFASSQPIIGNVTTFARYTYQLQWLDEDTVFVLTSANAFWRSTDDGKTWTELSAQAPFVGEVVRYFRKSPDQKTIAVTTYTHVYLSEDKGVTWQQVNAGGSFYWRFHPNAPGHALIFNVVGCQGTADCYYQLLATTDNGKTFKKIDTYVMPYFSWGDAGTNGVPVNRIYWCAHTTKTGIQGYNYDDVNYYYSDDFGATAVEVLKGGIAFEIHAPFTFILVYEGGENVGLYVSKDWVHSFRKTEFPFKNELQENEFNILDTSTGAAYVSVNHGAQNSVWEHLYISNSYGNMFGLSLDYLHRGPYGLSDFSKFNGLEGIYIANSMKVSEINSQNPLLSTYVTFDNGAYWVPLNPPEKDSNNQPIICSGAQCRLNLHYVSSWIFSGYGPYYSTANAIGLVLGTGNVGEYLSTEASNVNTYFSRDAGLSWYEIRKGSSIYEIGDHGSIIVLSENVSPTDSVMYTLDQGLTWNTIKIFNEPYYVDNIVIDSDTSMSFIVMGFDTNYDTKVVNVDLSQIHLRQCGTDDYEDFTPNDGRTDEKCVMGRTMVYSRKKRSAQCYNPNKTEHLKSSTNCKCEDRDYECDFGYQRVDGEGECVPVDGVNTVPIYCPAGTTYNKTDGYRKVAGNTCEGGVVHSVVATPCPSVKPTPSPGTNSSSSTFILIIVFILFCVLILGLIVATKVRVLREKIFPCIKFPPWWTGEQNARFTLTDDIFEEDDEENLLDSGKEGQTKEQEKIGKLEKYSANINDILDDPKKGEDDL